MKNILIFCILSLFSLNAVAAYKISGKINVKNSWQPVVYLATLNSPDDFFVASPDFIINSANINPDGTFTLNGDDLPDDLRFYRLYVNRNRESAVEFYPESQKNYIHILLNNNSKINIESLDDQAILRHVKITGSPDNIILNRFQEEFPNHKEQLYKEQSPVKNNLVRSSLDRYIKHFADTCRNTLIGLFAIYHLENKEADFLYDSRFYENFQAKLHAQYPASPYTGKYDELIKQFVGFRNVVCAQPDSKNLWKNVIISIETALILLLIFWIILLKRKTSSLKQESALILDSLKNEEESIEPFTTKERQILDLIIQNKSNKEIAQELFIELSTVKTHVNNIYRRLKVNNRQDAIKTYKSILLRESSQIR
ncbi:MAG: LuxR C-terminal-related transcriptional regulator [Bacteroidota bacterium]|nr:LuxR C-terminal-related transcriptional regulator [Bacteroidota bacterium]